MARSPYDRLSTRLGAGNIHVVVETPKGAQNKYKFDKKTGLFRLNRILFGGAVFPFDFGFVPGTLAGDGDPLDALVLMDEGTFPGCIVRARLVGVLLAKKAGKENHRLVTVPAVSKAFPHVRDIGDLSVGKLAEIEQFFRAILNVDGFEHELLGWGTREQADRIVAEGEARVLRKK